MLPGYQESKMTPLDWSLLMIAVVAIGFAVVVGLKVRSKKLRSKFGPEYDRVVKEEGSTLKAERELEQRTKRVENFQIHPLTQQESDSFSRDWSATQQKFVDDPRGAVADADTLVQRTMKARGYPVGGEFNDRTADLSVDHPRVIENYRAAHDIAERDRHNAASTEDLRIAMKHYRTLFEDLLDRPVGAVTEIRTIPEPRTITGARR
jgi:hypothetical protein